MSGETKQRLSDLEAENAALRKQLKNSPTLHDQFAMSLMLGSIQLELWEEKLNRKGLTDYEEKELTEIMESAIFNAYNMATAMLKERRKWRIGGGNLTDEEEEGLKNDRLLLD